MTDVILIYACERIRVLGKMYIVGSVGYNIEGEIELFSKRICFLYETF